MTEKVEIERETLALPPIKKVFFVLLYLSLAIFVYVIWVRSGDLPTDAYWDAVVAYLGICSAALIGFGVIFGKTDAKQLESRFNKISQDLDLAVASRRRFDEERAFEAALSSGKIDAVGIGNLMAKISSLSKYYDDNDPPDIASQRKIVEVFNKQKAMALDASIYFQVAIMIGVIGACIAIGRFIEKKLPSPQVQPISISKRHPGPFLSASKTDLEFPDFRFVSYPYPVILRCVDSFQLVTSAQGSPQGALPSEVGPTTIVPSSTKANVICERIFQDQQDQD